MIFKVVMVTIVLSSCGNEKTIGDETVITYHMTRIRMTI